MPESHLLSIFFCGETQVFPKWDGDVLPAGRRITMSFLMRRRLLDISPNSRKLSVRAPLRVGHPSTFARMRFSFANRTVSGCRIQRTHPATS